MRAEPPHASRSRARPPAVAKASVALLLAISLAACGRMPWRPRAAPVADPPTVSYRVKPGDTAGRIAAWHGVDVEELQLDGVEPGEPLVPGRVVRVPARPLATYTLRSGDTLGRVAQWYGVDVGALIHLNDVADVRRLPVGREIRIPATATRDGQRASTLAHARPTSRAAPAPRTPSVSAAPPPATPESDVDRELEHATAAYDAADFEAALATARRIEQTLDGAPADALARRRLARAHLLAGMSSVALGQEEDARCSFRSAVELDETIALDPALTSPKILTVFEDARAD